MLNKKFKYFSLDSLNKILHNDTTKVLKFLNLNKLAINTEINIILDAIINNNFEIARNTAHSLKSKLGYLGITNCQEKARDIELNINENNKMEMLIIINDIKDYWVKTKKEIDELF